MISNSHQIVFLKRNKSEFLHRSKHFLRHRIVGTAAYDNDDHLLIPFLIAMCSVTKQ